MSTKLSDGSIYPHIPVICNCMRPFCYEICWHGNYKKGHYISRKGMKPWNKNLEWSQEIKDKLSISNSKAWKDPEIRKSYIEGITTSSAKPEVKERRSKAMTEVWSDVERRKRISEKQKIIKNLPEAKQKTSERMKIIANDPEVIAKIKATKKKNHHIYSYEDCIRDFGEPPICSCDECQKNGRKIEIKSDKNGSFYYYKKKHGYPKFISGHNKIGKDNPNWKGGKKSLYKRIRDSQRYIDWRISVYERDSYTCQNCRDDVGGNLEAHHCNKKFVDILYENNITSLDQALSCSELWNISNGQTLCIKCHKETENYGKKKTNTKLQIIGEKINE